MESMVDKNWEAERMLHLYMYDHFMKRKWYATASALKKDAGLQPEPIAFDSPGGFLLEWWVVFWAIFITKTNNKYSKPAAAYIETQNAKARERELQMQLLRQYQAQGLDPNSPSLSSAGYNVNSEGVFGHNATPFGTKIYGDNIKRQNIMHSETSQRLDARGTLLKSSPIIPPQSVQGAQIRISEDLQKIQSRIQDVSDIKMEASLSGATQRTLPMDPPSVIIRSKSGLENDGMETGVNGVQFGGWPLTGSDAVQPSRGPQVQNGNHFPLLPHQQHPFLAPIQAQRSICSPTSYEDKCSPRFPGLNRVTQLGKNSHDGPIGSPMQSTSSKGRKKRKDVSSYSRAAKSNGTGNIVGYSPNSQGSTPSTLSSSPAPSPVPTDRSNSTSKSFMLYGADGSLGLASSLNQPENVEQYAVVSSLDGNVQSTVAQDGAGKDSLVTLKPSTSEYAVQTAKGFSFVEIGSVHVSDGKLICCDFSSDGRFLASAGHDKKVAVSSIENLKTEFTPEEHTHIVSDLRFRPNSTQLATSSFDKTVRIWDAAKSNQCVQTYTGHSSPVMSLDFHPTKEDLFCSSDANSEIRYWNLNQSSSTRISRATLGVTTQVRFQPRIGQYLAAASDKVVTLFDTETDRETYLLQGHPADVQSICWDKSGDYLASISLECVKIWRLASGECIHELLSSGNKFHSCLFHPKYSTLLIVGGYKTIELWNMVENKCMTIPTHDDVISSLAHSQATGMVASVSHDKSLKIWK